MVTFKIICPNNEGGTVWKINNIIKKIEYKTEKVEHDFTGNINVFCLNGSHINIIVKNESKQGCWKINIDLDITIKMSKGIEVEQMMKSVKPHEEEHYHQSVALEVELHIPLLNQWPQQVILVKKLGNFIRRTYICKGF